MIRVYAIASGKGGTGKTTVTANLGPMLARHGRRTCILDADTGMANLALILGLENLPVTLHEVLAGKASIQDAIYDGPLGVKIIPSGLSLQGFQSANPDRLKEVLQDLVDDFDIMLLDAPAGISKDGVIPLAVADEVLLIVNPEISSIVDAIKTR
ncbi:MAG: cell division ATPase MinD, partial [Methanomicrobiaceae archaeon]|nr:cell division ATPase MinD [Methanomicrobiaceae archaeon]